MQCFMQPIWQGRVDRYGLSRCKTIKEFDSQCRGKLLLKVMCYNIALNSLKSN